jgi:hypothetical protein
MADVEREKDETENDSGVDPIPKEEFTDYEDFVLVTPKGRRKPNIKTIQSINGKCRNGKENPTTKQKKKPRGAWKTMTLRLVEKKGKKKS